MADRAWSQGYHAAAPYFDTVQPEMCPASMDLSLLVAGFRPPRTGPAFRFAELGCGTAGTLIGLAALYPQARFLGIDFMPEHVARARALIAVAGLDNIEIREASFADLVAAPDPEPFDYVSLHGSGRGSRARTRRTWPRSLGVGSNRAVWPMSPTIARRAGPRPRRSARSLSGISAHGTDRGD